MGIVTPIFSEKNVYASHFFTLNQMLIFSRVNYVIYFLVISKINKFELWFFDPTIF